MIRKALKRDCLDLAALSLQVWLHTYAVKGVRSQISKYALSTFNEEYFAKLLKRECIDVRVFEEDSHLIGFIVADLNSELEDVSGYEIVTLYVSQHFHGKGVGRQLLREIESAHGLPFWLSTWVNNHDAIGFYDKLGFNIVGELNFNLEGSCTVTMCLRTPAHNKVFVNDFSMLIRFASLTFWKAFRRALKWR